MPLILTGCVVLAQEPNRQRRTIRSVVQYLTPPYADGTSSLFAFPSLFLTCVFFNDPFTIYLIMRFSTFAIFMLPLAALAAPTPPPSIQAQVDKARELFTAALVETSGGINATIALATAIPQPDVLEEANRGNEKLGLAFNAALRIQAAVMKGVVPSDAEYVDNPFARAQCLGQND
jgi:hypothetical protein